MARATTRLLPVLALLAAAPAARAQLGIDLSAPATKKPAARKPAAKKPAAKPPPAAAPEVTTAPEAPSAPAASPEGEPLAPAAQGKPAPARDTALSLPVLDVRKAAPSAEAQSRLAAAKKLLDEKATETAALAFDQILREPSLGAVHDEARYQLGKALARLGLHHSALGTFDAILDKGPQASRFYGSAMEWLFYVGRRLDNEQPVLSRVAKHARDAFPPGYEDKFHFLLAKYEFERGRALKDAGRAQEAQGAWAEARRLSSMVREQAGAAPAPVKGDAPNAPEGDLFAKSRFVEGLVLYASGEDVKAIEAFKDVVRITNPKRGRVSEPALREQAFLQLARIHYQYRQNRYAIFYYGKMPWGGENWLEGLWEASYAHYRIGDYEKTLGNLLTLQSPYFKDEYYPESYILKAIVYYENCRYPEARRVLESFTSIYEPVYDELARLTSTPRPAPAYYELVQANDHAGGMTRKIMKLAHTDQNVRQLAASIREVEDEMDRGIGGRRSEFRQSALAKRLGETLTAEKASLVEEAGARARGKLEYERDQLRTLLAQALRIRIEVSRKEREALEGSLAKGSQVDVVRDLKYSSAVSDEHLYWPYEGEFWRDELGTYSYTLTRGCKDRLNRPRTTSK
jgi:tetratricopeptide (TPR) repeat protein